MSLLDLPKDDAIKLLREAVEFDINDAREELADVCSDCWITALIESYPRSDWNGIAIGLSMMMGVANNDEMTESIFHWLKHVVKMIDTDVLASDTLEVEKEQ